MDSGRVLDTGEELIEAQSGEYGIKQAGCKAFRASGAEGVACRKSDKILCRFGRFNVRSEGIDERLAVLKGLFKASNIIRQTVIKAGKGADVEDHLFLRDPDSFIVNSSDGLNEPEIDNTVILDSFDEHSLLLYRRTY